MTVSVVRREEDIQRALLAMADAIGEDYCFAKLFPVKEFGDILPTTWHELEEKHWVSPRHAFGNPQFQLTELGWLKAVEIRGSFDDPELRARGVRLVKALKHIIEGRNQFHDSYADERDIAARTGLPAGWTHNAIKSGLLQRLFPNDKMNAYYDPRGRCFRVPPTFGMDWRE